MPSILLIEDEAAIADTLVYALQTEGHVVEWVTLGRVGLERAARGDVDLVILDVGLPDSSGFDVCRDLRRTSDVPVLFLTARSGEIDRIVGLELGGDDYVSKPFSPREVAARVRSILKRTRPPAGEEAPRRWFDVDVTSGRALYFDVPLRLTRYELLLLSCLLARPGRIFSRAQLMDLVWSDAPDSDERTVDTHIKTLRAKLRQVQVDPDPIQTHRHMGYSISNGSR